MTTRTTTVVTCRYCGVWLEEELDARGHANDCYIHVSGYCDRCGLPGSIKVHRGPRRRPRLCASCEEEAR